MKRDVIMRNVVIGVIISLGSTLLVAMASSDPPPWGNIIRSESLRSQIFRDQIGNIWFNEYCPAAERGNVLAMRAAEVEIESDQESYARVNGSREVALLPC